MIFGCGLDLEIKLMVFFQGYLVSGGNGRYTSYLSSTEILVGDTWQEVGELPQSMSHMTVVSIDNSVFLTG